MLNFTYDESGHPLTMRRYFNEAQSNYCTYHYILNAQGDVVKLMYGANKTVAEYSYDAWGNVLNISGADLSVAKLNSLRYRGYYCDPETGFYYLQSRYYDPIVRRFLNADSYGSTGQGILGYNMFAYCNNNPVISTDPTGYMACFDEKAMLGGSADCLTYEYTCTVSFRHGGQTYDVTKHGYVYICRNLDPNDENALSNKQNQISGFTKGNDFVVGDYTKQVDANMKVYDSYLCKHPSQMEAIAEILQNHAKCYAPKWNRTNASIILEWEEHNRYALFSESAMHVDLNNNEEGKGRWFFFQKAYRHALGIENMYE